ncbi:hypothetical protein ACD591_05220 [Rufibacter glacialis]|uniref:Uncharacterized protein n=1 Tax=Rufibacter glacialis TaxID=1259555 RepID=A0A5M8QHN5_9BACT|nr:hypothetical protein [Rufibacter glacialis]KAA6434748.1 hypothetical protein FOE74_11275 [Rufibacter glacialis]GGK72098.1 hypothetical protein GCM10011405_20410 [Rufibacter glacialis]
MIKNRAVLNSDTVNRYGYRFSVGALEDALEQKALEGVPTCLGHDMHKPLGWTIPFGLYFEPGMCRLVGNQIIAETDEEQKFINKAHLTALKKRYQEQCLPHIDELKSLLAGHLTENATYLYAGCVCYNEKKIVERVFSKLFEKQDKDGLIYLSDLLQQFTYKGHGIFKDNDSEFAVIAHQFFRKSLSLHNNLNYFLIDELVKQVKNEKIKVRISLDRNLIGLAKTYNDTIELEYWRGPQFNNDVSKIKSGVTVYGSSEYQKLYYGISQTEFWWKHEEGKQTLEVEEVKEHPSLGIDNDNYGCRYVHSIFDEATNSFEHFDGAIRMCDTEKMLSRIENDIKSAGKQSEYTKLFRVDGELSIEDWKSLTCHYFQANPLIHEYFDEAKEEANAPHLIEEKAKSVFEELIPYSINEGDGIRLFVSYHEIQKREDDIHTERYISGYDIISIGETSLRVIETDILEVVKALKRIGEKLDLPKNVTLASFEDMYWNIPAINHGINENTEFNVSKTLQALEMIFAAKVSRNKDTVAAFTLSWERQDEKQVSVSVMGHSVDILKWLNENKIIPVDKNKFKNWLEKQSTFINKYPLKRDSPPLFEMVCGDGVQYIRRRGIAPEIKYQLKPDQNGGIIIGFAFTKEQYDLAKAYETRKIDVTPGYLLKKQICTKCGNDYKYCEHSTNLDNDVSVSIDDFQLLNLTWTDRKA